MNLVIWDLYPYVSGVFSSYTGKKHETTNRELIKKFNSIKLDKKQAIKTPFDPRKIKPVYIIEDLETSKKTGELNQTLKHKSGIYCWYNNKNGKIYIGSAKILLNRILDYTQNQYLKDRSDTLIVKALKKYSLRSFTLYILELISPDKASLLEAEQKYIDLFVPEYNLAKIAGSSLGTKHTEETKQKIRTLKLGTKHSKETRELMSITRKGEYNSFFGKTHTNETKETLKKYALNRTKSHNKGYKVTLTDTKNKAKVLTFDSVRKVADFLNTTTTSVLLHNNYIIKARYLVHIDNQVPSINAKSKKIRGFSTLVPTNLINIKNGNILPFRSISAAAIFIGYKVANFSKKNNEVIDKKLKNSYNYEIQLIKLSFFNWMLFLLILFCKVIIKKKFQNFCNLPPCIKP